MKKEVLCQSRAILLLVCVAACISFSFVIHNAQDVPSFISVDIGDIKAGTTTLINNGDGIKLQGYGTMFGMHHGADEGRFVCKDQR